VQIGDSDGFSSEGAYQLPIAPGLFGAVTELKHRKKSYLDLLLSPLEQGEGMHN
jgi:hypothetical protein